MKKDNFDLRSYLIENKMTENSRGDVRHQLGETILDTRILSEMQIPADPDQDDPKSFITLCREKGYEVDDPRRAILWATMRDQFSDPDKSVLDAKLGVNDANVDQWLSRQDELNTEPDVMEEAGYTDDDDDWQDDNLDLDDRGGASLLDLVKGDKKAGRARKAAAVDTAADPAMDDEPVDTDAPDIDDPDAENAAGTSDPNAEAQPGLSAQVKYNPNTVEMMMDDQELDQYLSGFRRPQVAVNVLNRAIRTAQDEVNDSIGLNHLYIVLENGFYVTSRTERGQVIAKVNADQEWRKKNFGED